MSLDRYAIRDIHKEALAGVDDWLNERASSPAVQERERIAAANLKAYYRKKQSLVEKAKA